MENSEHSSPLDMEEKVGHSKKKRLLVKEFNAPYSTTGVGSLLI